MKNPDGRFKCLACGSEWSGWQLHLDPTSTAVRWTCGDPFCGGTVVRIETAVTQPEETNERCIAELTRINKKQRNEIAGLRRQNDLLLDLLEDVRNGDPSIEAMPAYRAAVDGGALGGDHE